MMEDNDEEGEYVLPEGYGDSNPLSPIDEAQLTILGNRLSQLANEYDIGQIEPISAEGNDVLDQVIGATISLGEGDDPAPDTSKEMVLIYIGMAIRNSTIKSHSDMIEVLQGIRDILWSSDNLTNYDENPILKLHNLYRVKTASPGEYLTPGEIYELDALSRTSVGLHSPTTGAGTYVRRRNIGHSVTIEEAEFDMTLPRRGTTMTPEELIAWEANQKTLPPWYDPRKNDKPKSDVAKFDEPEKPLPISRAGHPEPEEWSAVTDVSNLQGKDWTEDNAWQNINRAHGYGSPSIETELSSEPISGFLDRYIPDWRDLDEYAFGHELNDLQDQFHFTVFDPDGPGDFGGGAGIPEAIQDDPGRFHVRYYPSGTAAFKEPTSSTQFTGQALRVFRLSTSTGHVTPVAFYILDQNQVNIKFLTEAAERWEAEAIALMDNTGRRRTRNERSRRAQFASDTAFVGAKLLAGDGCCVMVGIDPSDGEIVGVSVFHTFEDKSANISLMTVSPRNQPHTNADEQLRGVGTSMVCLMGQQFKNAGITRICLHPLDSEAENFWRNRGFRPDQAQLCIINDPDLLIESCLAPECPDNGDCASIGAFSEMEEYTKPSLRS